MAKKTIEKKITLGRDAEGKLIRRNVRGKTKAEVEKKAFEMRQKWLEKATAPNRGMTFITFARHWFNTAKALRSINTRAMYSNVIEKHLEPQFHDLYFDEITLTDLQLMINRKAGSPETCKKIKLTLSQIYAAALEEGYPANVNISKLVLPVVQKKEKRALTEEEKNALFEAKDLTDEQRAFVLTLYYTGLRREEALALAKKADVFVIAPATANVIAKAAHGIADDMLTSTFLAATCEKLVVPAMNTHMLENPATQENIETLRRRGIRILDSDSGYLACGDTGKGRMPEASVICDAVCSLMESDRWLAGKKIVVTAGPTRESLDPVRFITNHSSGKMGYALARAARDLGADVTLVTGRTNLAAPVNVEVVDAESAGDMADAVLSRFADCDAAIFAAAVADYRPADYSNQKIKKKDGDLALPLARTVDILKTCGERKQKGQKLIGFAMETQDLLKNARVKLEKKNADFIVANTLTEAGAGFGVDTNHVTILSPDGEHDLGQLSKEETARKILEFCLR